MAKFSDRSSGILNTCHEDLQTLFKVVVKEFDCTVLDGHRSEERQQELFNQGKSKVQYPNSMHNTYPSLAVDVAPYPIEWDNTERFYYFAGFVMGTAKRLNINLRWGGDWDRDTRIKDQDFNDLVHFEIRGD